MSEAPVREVLSLRGVDKSFSKGGRTIEVLSGLSLTLRAGETAAVLGASGAGKSTLLHIVGGLDRPTAGSVKVEGTEVFSLPEDRLAAFRAHTVGYVFQMHYLLPEFTCLENVSLPGLIARRDPGEVEGEARSLLARVGLEQRAGHRPGELSGGEQQRAAVARALINRPALVLADEPTGNLDARTGESVQQLFLDLNREMGTTFLVVTHNLDLAGRLGARHLLRDGHLARVE
jgi:lipoprotein-releasing system ATP-binding protein